MGKLPSGSRDAASSDSASLFHQMHTPPYQTVARSILQQASVITSDAHPRHVLNEDDKLIQASQPISVGRIRPQSAAVQGRVLPLEPSRDVAESSQANVSKRIDRPATALSAPSSSSRPVSAPVVKHIPENAPAVTAPKQSVAVPPSGNAKSMARDSTQKALPPTSSSRGLISSNNSDSACAQQPAVARIPPLGADLGQYVKDAVTLGLLPIGTPTERDKESGFLVKPANGEQFATTSGGSNSLPKKPWGAGSSLRPMSAAAAVKRTTQGRDRENKLKGMFDDGLITKLDCIIVPNAQASIAPIVVQKKSKSGGIVML